MAPTHGFLRYIERVLPSLGESGVVMLTPGELFPGIEATDHDDDAVARLKGDAAMAELLSRAVKQRQVVPSQDIPLRIEGDRKSTRLNSSHVAISYAVFCLKKKKH